ncbi:MAG: DUF975 family protein [Clostridia bacterium]|nr:DUF975 family protein [Clostridia bacterium]
MNRSELKNRAKQALNGNWGAAILGVIVYMVVISILSSTGVGAFVTGLVAVGYISLYLGILRGMNPGFEGCISAITENIGTKFIATLLVSLYTFLWSLLFIIPGIVKSYSYAMTPYILLDRPELSPTEAIKESEKMMNGHKMDLFILDLSFIGWILLSMLTCGVLILYVEPYMMATKAAFYLELKGPDPEPEAEAEEQQIYTPEA